VQVDRGLYRLAEAPVTELSSLAQIGKRVPHAVICLLSALQVDGLTAESPRAVWVLIDRHARLPKLASPKLEVVRASGAARRHGVESRVIDGVKVHLTWSAKTVADCFEFRRHVGLDALGVCRAAIYKLCERGELAHVRVSNAIRFKRQHLAAFLARQRGEH